MSKGIKNNAKKLGYEIEIYSANNITKIELENLSKVINKKVDGLIISPINSSTAVTILKLAKNANIPVVISDIGTDSGDYVSYISSDNEKGAYEIGKVLVNKMRELNIDKTGTVGIISIPQKRANGQARTKGFMKAMNEAKIVGAGLLQQVDFSYDETYKHSMTLIKNNPNLVALWLQGSDRYQAALDAIRDSKKEGKILLLCFDAEPIFLELIPKGKLVGAAMQQPYLMGQKAVESIDNHLKNKSVSREQKLDILAISEKNIKEKLPIIKRNVLGLE
jgi:ribose transport system substrate-binding protein